MFANCFKFCPYFAIALAFFTSGLFAEDYETAFRSTGSGNLIFFGDVHEDPREPGANTADAQARRDRGFISEVAQLSKGQKFSGPVIVLLEDGPMGEEIHTNHFNRFIAEHPELKTRGVVYFGADNVWLKGIGSMFLPEQGAEAAPQAFRAFEVSSLFRSYFIAKNAEAASRRFPDSLVVAYVGYNHITDMVAKEYLESNGVSYEMKLSQAARDVPEHKRTTIKQIEHTRPDLVSHFEKEFAGVDEQFFQIIRQNSSNPTDDWDELAAREHCDDCQCFLRKMGAIR